VVALIVAGAGYVVLLRNVDLDLRGEHVFTAPSGNAPAHIYIEPVAINATSDSMQLRVGIVSAGPAGDPPSSDPEHDFTLLLGHDEVVERVEVHAHRPAPVTIVDLDLHDGDVRAYPLDAYQAALWFRVIGGPTPQTDAAPAATVWERVLGFRLQASEQPSTAPGERRLLFEIRRGVALTFFVLAAYAAMAVLGIGGFTVGTLVFLGIRKPEATLMGALAGIVFALPALRNALPGAAPLGVNADIFVFLWAELLAVSAIGLLIFTWARTGPKP
jgi:hypothetical protein